MIRGFGYVKILTKSVLSLDYFQDILKVSIIYFETKTFHYIGLLTVNKIYERDDYRRKEMELFLFQYRLNKVHIQSRSKESLNFQITKIATSVLMFIIGN